MATALPGTPGAEVTRPSEQKPNGQVRNAMGEATRGLAATRLVLTRRSRREGSRSPGSLQTSRPGQMSDQRCSPAETVPWGACPHRAGGARGANVAINRRDARVGLGHHALTRSVNRSSEADPDFRSALAPPAGERTGRPADSPFAWRWEEDGHPCWTACDISARRTQRRSGDEASPVPTRPGKGSLKPFPSRCLYRLEIRFSHCKQKFGRKSFCPAPELSSSAQARGRCGRPLRCRGAKS
jgi:hypothetical protein